MSYGKAKESIGYSPGSDTEVPGIKGKSVELEVIGWRGLANCEQATATCSMLYNQNKESPPEKIVMKFSSRMQHKQNEEQRTASRLHTGRSECKKFGNYTG